MHSTPKTGIVEARFDLRRAAAIAKYYAENKCPARTKSELVSHIIDDFYEVLLANNKVQEITSTEQAIELLSELGLMGFSSQGRGRRALAAQLKLESGLRETTADSFDVKDIVRQINIDAPRPSK